MPEMRRFIDQFCPSGYRTARCRQPSGSILFFDLIVVLDRSKVVREYSLRNFTPDLVPILHRVAPVQPSPDTRILDLPRNVVQVVKRPFGLYQLRHRIFASL